MQKENQKQQQELEDASAQEKELQCHQSVYTQQYYENRGRLPPKSEDEVDYEDNDELFNPKPRPHLVADFDQDLDNESGSPIRMFFPTALRNVSVRTQSPPRTVRKSASKAPVAKLGNLPTPPSTQQSSVRDIEKLPATQQTPATTTPEAPELPQQSHEAGLEEQLQLRQLELIPSESGKLLRDYHGKSKKLLRRAIQTYEATVLAACLCPDSELQSSWVNGIWAEEMAALPEDEAEYELMDEVEYYLDQWSTGSCKPKNLDEDVLAPIWVKHMSQVKEEYAGIGLEWLEKPVKMSKEDQKRATEELCDLRIPESDDENEGSEDESDRETDMSSPNASALELDTNDNGTEGQGIACDNAHGPGSNGLELEKGDNLVEQNMGDVDVVPANSDSGSLTTGDTPGSSAAVVEENVQAVPKHAEVQKALKKTKKQATQV
ncbi:hypothetical protein BT96DRAFT_1004263 [Gymnopus androsaceus JB14]|uniref:Uncharacterized protein n=1 Tax=Gymnopus androsaceus JB14 TaxID=1447944 RepID=A0A6A4GT32_9AGAR|nr:hypothetical protein BT96DRAFT_1004263 [Gymnopus androsaceus JB14]